MRDFEEVAAFPDQSGTPVPSWSGALRCSSFCSHQCAYIFWNGFNTLCQKVWTA
jgi:hypothetical protein